MYIYYYLLYWYLYNSYIGSDDSFFLSVSDIGEFFISYVHNTNFIRMLFVNITTLVPTGAGKYTGMPDAFLILVLSGGYFGIIFFCNVLKNFSN